MTQPDGSSRARQRRYLAALAVTYAFRLSVGMLVVLPVVNAAQASGVTQFPASDHAIFEAGGAMFLEVLMSQRAELLASVTPTLVMLAIAALLAAGPEFLWFWALGAAPRRSLGESARRSLPGFVLIGAVIVPLRALALGVSFALALGVHSWFESTRDERIADGVFLGMLALAGGVQLALSTLRDLAGAALVARSARPLDSMLAALSTLRLSTLAAHAAALSATSLLYLGGAALTDVIDVSRPDSWRTAIALVMHQTIVVGSIALRALWLSLAVRAIS